MEAFLCGISFEPRPPSKRKGGSGFETNMECACDSCVTIEVVAFLNQSLVSYFFRLLGSFIFSNDLIATAGATQGLNMITHLFFSPGDLVFVEDPSYFIGIKMLMDDCGMKIVSGAP